MCSQEQYFFVERLRSIRDKQTVTKQMSDELQNVIDFFSNPANIGVTVQGIPEPNVYEYHTKDESVWLTVCDLIHEVCEFMKFNQSTNPYVFMGTQTEYCFCDYKCFRIIFRNIIFSL